MASKGYGAPDVEQVYARAQALCERLGGDANPQLFQVLFGLLGVYMARAELQKAHDMAQQSLSLAQRRQDQRLLLCAHYMPGATLFHLGEVGAHTYIEQALHNLPSPTLPMFFYGHDIGVVCLAYAAWAAWWCGYAQQARQRSQAALALAHELAHPFSLAFAHIQAAMVHQFHREIQAAQE